MKANEAQMFEFVKFEMLGSLEIAQRVILAGGEEDTFAPMVHVYSQNEENGVVCGLLQLPMSAADEEPDEEDPHGMESIRAPLESSRSPRTVSRRTGTSPSCSTRRR